MRECLRRQTRLYVINISCFASPNIIIYVCDDDDGGGTKSIIIIQFEFIRKLVVKSVRGRSDFAAGRAH